MSRTRRMYEEREFYGFLGRFRIISVICADDSFTNQRISTPSLHVLCAKPDKRVVSNPPAPCSLIHSHVAIGLTRFPQSNGSLHMQRILMCL
mmetsp:Transcript_11003/g.40972  ORF Transcript_11003/g.40972 Transcript_11003/m.40972 type:complete len:92 (-) Transcript_11003:250-525(-)